MAVPSDSTLQTLSRKERKGDESHFALRMSTGQRHPTSISSRYRRFFLRDIMITCDVVKVCMISFKMNNDVLGHMGKIRRISY